MLVSATAAPFVKFRSQQPDNNLSRRSCRASWRGRVTGDPTRSRCDDVCGYQISMYTSMSKLGTTDNLSSNQENVVLSGVKDQWPLVWPRGGVEAGSGDHSSGSGWRREYSQPGMDILSRNHLLFSHCKPSFFLRPQIKDLKLKPHFHSKSPCIIFFLRKTDHSWFCSPSLHSALLSASAPPHPRSWTQNSPCLGVIVLYPAPADTA